MNGFFSLVDPNGTHIKQIAIQKNIMVVKIKFSLVLISLYFYSLMGQTASEQQIIFNSDGNTKASELYSINTNGLGLKQLTFDAVPRRGNEGAQFSPDGKYIAFATYKYGGWKIALANSDFSGQKRWTKSPHYTWGASWSPDSKSLVYNKVDTPSSPYFNGKIEIYRMDLNGTKNVNLSNTETEDYSPQWSPDGTKIVFYSNRDGNFEVYSMDPDGKNQINLTNTPNYDEFAPSWSPDSRKIAYHRMQKTERQRYIDTYIMEADGSHPVDLTHNQKVKRNPYNPYYSGAPPTYGYQTAWSPDGIEIAFSSRRTGNFELFIVKADGSYIRQLTKNGDNNMYPHYVN